VTSINKFTIYRNYAIINYEKKVNELIYVTSDTHFSHANIIKYCNRPFKNIDEMNYTLIQKWNEVVNEDDEVYHLGDFAFVQRKDNSISYKETLKRHLTYLTNKLNGKIHLILGNHDSKISTMSSCGFESVQKGPLEMTYEGINCIFSHVPLDNVPVDYVNIHGHIHNTFLPQYIKHYYINISTDITGFKPVLLDSLITIYQYRLMMLDNGMKPFEFYEKLNKLTMRLKDE
jgi:calcineurin-like phosphoesterase family protein